MTYLFVGEKDLIEKSVNEIRKKEKIEGIRFHQDSYQSCFEFAVLILLEGQ